MPKVQDRRKPLYPRVSRDLHDRFKAYVAATGNSESAVVEAALQDYLDPARDATLLRTRLNRLVAATNRIETQVGVSLEALLGYIRMWLTHMPPLTAEARTAAVNQGLLRFEGFMQQLREEQYLGAREGPGTLAPPLQARPADDVEEPAPDPEEMFPTDDEWDAAARGV